MLINQLYKKCETLATEQLERYRITQPPIPIDKIAREIGLNIVDFQFENDIAGALVIEKDIGTIGINPSNSPQRRRFTIAHELGHYLMHRVGNEFFVDKDFLVKWRNSASSSYSEIEKYQEIEANAFAAAILMPKNFIVAEMEKPEMKSLAEAQLINKLASRFKVSMIAMSYRLTNINNNYI